MSAAVVRTSLKTESHGIVTVVHSEDEVIGGDMPSCYANTLQFVNAKGQYCQAILSGTTMEYLTASARRIMQASRRL